MTITKITVKFNSGYTEDQFFPTAESAQGAIDWFTNAYYKSRIQTFWVNDVEFQEPPL